MNPVMRNAQAVLAKLHDWRHETFAVDGNMLLSATKLTPTEINDAVAYLERLGAVEIVGCIGTDPYDFGEVSITSQGEYLYQDMVSRAHASTSDVESTREPVCDHDCFICHASEDKARFVDALARGLRDAGCKVWYDDFVLKVGDSLRRKIDEGLLKSRHGVVVLSRAFFKKEWPKKELDGLAALAKDRGILPVWLDVTKDDIVRFSPTLADIVAAKASDGLAKVIRELQDAMGKPSRITGASEGPIVADPAVTLTKQESELLAAAARDGKLYHCRTAQIPAGWVRAGKANFIDKSDPAAAALHVDALESLVSKRYAKHDGGILYVLTGLGLSAARSVAGNEARDNPATDGHVLPQGASETMTRDDNPAQDAADTSHRASYLCDLEALLRDERNALRAQLDNPAWLFKETLETTLDRMQAVHRRRDRTNAIKAKLVLAFEEIGIFNRLGEIASVDGMHFHNMVFSFAPRLVAIGVRRDRAEGDLKHAAETAENAAISAEDAAGKLDARKCQDEARDYRAFARKFRREASALWLECADELVANGKLNLAEEAKRRGTSLRRRAEGAE